MIIKLSRTGKFYSCAKFPDCVGARKIDGTEMEPPKEIGEKCPECDEGELIEREGRFGMFIACARYPKCKNIIKTKPTGNICQYPREYGPCGNLMMEGTKRIPERCSDKTCPNHNPHKLTQRNAD